MDYSSLNLNSVWADDELPHKQNTDGSHNNETLEMIETVYGVPQGYISWSELIY